MEDGPGNGDGLKFLLMGAIVGAGISYAYSCHYNNNQSKKIATDGRMIVGGLLGAFILPFAYIAVTK